MVDYERPIAVDQPAIELAMKRVKMRATRPTSIMCLYLSLAATIGPSWAIETTCGPLKEGIAIGPLDYYKDDRSKLKLVEDYHFDAGVASLTKTMTGPFGVDLDYTLRAFPNHPRALTTMMRLVEREKTERPIGARYTLYCYFERAMRFRPEDGYVRFLYARYLLKKGRSADAKTELDAAARFAANNGNLHYNLGLVFFDIGDNERALEHAHKALQLGYELPGLRRKLFSAGAWKDPLPAGTAGGATAPPAVRSD